MAAGWFWPGTETAVREERRTLTRYTIASEHLHPGSTGDFSGLLNAVATAVKIISNQVNHGALVGALGSAGVENVEGEVQKRPDLISNEAMIGETEWTGYLAAMASEEMQDIYPILECQRRGKYLLVFDWHAENLVLALAGRVCSACRLAVMITGHVPAVHGPPGHAARRSRRLRFCQVPIGVRPAETIPAVP
jgi:Fructose-1-6-bisphosphatase, N-terminal domain